MITKNLINIFLMILTISLVSAIDTVNIIGDYDYDGGSLIDSTDSNRYLINHGSISTTGQVNEGYLFDGINDYQQLNTNNLPSGDNSRSISSWIYLNSLGTHDLIVSYGTSGAKTIFSTYVKSDNKFCAVDDLTIWCSTTSIQLNTWTHVSMTYDSTTSLMKLYINGVLDNTHTLTYDLQTTQSKSYIGAQISNANYFDGIIDEVFITDNVLSDSEVFSLYQPGPPNNLPIIMDISPSNNSNISYVPNLQVTVYDEDADNVTVKYYLGGIDLGEEITQTVPFTNPAVCYDSLHDTIWLQDWTEPSGNPTTMREYNKDTIIATGNSFIARAPGQNCAYDDVTDTFWMYSASGVIYNMDRSGTELSSFSAPNYQDGLDLLPNGNIVTCRGSATPNYLTVWSPSGNVIDQWVTDVPCDGIAIRTYDSNNSIRSYWISDDTNKKLVEYLWDTTTTKTGNEITPDDIGVEGLDFESENILWHSNDDHGGGTSNKVYKYILESSPSYEVTILTNQTSSYIWNNIVDDKFNLWKVTLNDGTDIVDSGWYSIYKYLDINETIIYNSTLNNISLNNISNQINYTSYTINIEDDYSMCLNKDNVTLLDIIKLIVLYFVYGQ